MNRSFHTLLAIFILLAGAPFAAADDAKDIQARMSKRLSSLVALKKSGALGEDNKGLLSVRSAVSKKNNTLIIAENTDRKTIYGMIAKKTGSIATTVAKARAKTIHATAPKGTWIQGADGKWFKQK